MAESPFIETETEGSLRRIAEADRERRETLLAMLQAKADYKEAKSAYEKACQYLFVTAESETVELPLFPGRATFRPRRSPTPRPTQTRSPRMTG